MTRTAIGGLSGLLAAGMVAVGLGGPAGGGEEGGWWPQFHGPRRDNISTETGLLRKWPDGGPRLLWKYTGCGRGHAGVSVAKGLIYTTGDFGPKEKVIALHLDGTPAWQADNGESWRGPIPGSRTTPTYDDGVVYQMNPTGRLAAYDATSGKQVWAVQLRTTYGAKPARWSLAENVIIDGDVLLCVPGGEKGRVAALRKATGQGLWANTEIAQPAAYCSPLIVTHNKVRQIVVVVQKSVVSVDVRTGELLWTHPHQTKNDQNVTMPIFWNGYVYVSSGHGTGGKLLKIAADSRGVKEVWSAKDLDNCHGGVILVDGYLYGSGCRLYRRGLVCADFLTGETKWSERTLGKVSLTCAEGMLYCLDDRGKVSLVEADPRRCRIVSSFDLPRTSRGLVLSHPVVCGGRLYIRDGDDLFAYDVRAAAIKVANLSF